MIILHCAINTLYCFLMDMLSDPTVITHIITIRYVMDIMTADWEEMRRDVALAVLMAGSGVEGIQHSTGL